MDLFYTTIYATKTSVNQAGQDKSINTKTRKKQPLKKGIDNLRDQIKFEPNGIQDPKIQIMSEIRPYDDENRERGSWIFLVPIVYAFGELCKMSQSWTDVGRNDLANWSDDEHWPLSKLTARKISDTSIVTKMPTPIYVIYNDVSFSALHFPKRFPPRSVKSLFVYLLRLTHNP